MKKEEALKIIGMIADGLDPYREKASPKSLPESNPVTMRAVCTVIMFLLSSKDRGKLKSKYETKSLFDMVDFVTGPLKVSIEKEEEWAIQDALDATNFDETEAAEKLGISIERLRSRLPRYDLDSLVVVRKFFDRNRNHLTLDSFLAEIEIEVINEALDNTNYNKTATAKLLGISFRSLRYRLDQYKNDRNNKYTKSKYIDYYQIESLDDFLKEIEHGILKEALKRTGDSKSKAAKLLGITFRSFRYKIDRLGAE